MLFNLGNIAMPAKRLAYIFIYLPSCTCLNKNEEMWETFKKIIIIFHFQAI